MKRKGNRHRTPPTEQQMWAMVAKARELTPPAFADYLETACFTGMRPGELDARARLRAAFDASPRTLRMAAG